MILLEVEAHLAEQQQQKKSRQSPDNCEKADDPVKDSGDGEEEGYTKHQHEGSGGREGVTFKKEAK